MRVFVFGIILVACAAEPVRSRPSAGGAAGAVINEAGADSIAAGGAPQQPSAGDSNSDSGAAGVEQEDAGGSAQGGSPSAVCSPGASTWCSCGASEGSKACDSDGAWKACQCAPSGGAGGMSSGGAGGIGGAHPTAGSASVAGSAGDGSDPLAPFPAPGCPGFTAYRVPKGSYLAVTSGDSEVAEFKNGVCTPPMGTPTYQRCSVFSNVNQCVCPVASPPTCGQYCDGDYYVVVIRPKSGDTLQIALHDGNGACVGGTPTRIGN